MPKNVMMTPATEYDVITLYTFAMFSLLSGEVVCTKPTEMEEVQMRYDDFVRILSKDAEIKLVCASESYWPQYPEDKWPWATTLNEYRDYVALAVRDVPESATADLQVITMSALLANEEIEEKYRLSRVRPKLFSQMLLPF